MNTETMKVYIDKIEPRDSHDVPVMNVEVLFVVPVEDKRFVHVRVTVFVDKGAKTMDEVRRSAIRQSLDVLQSIPGRHP